MEELKKIIRKYFRRAFEETYSDEVLEELAQLIIKAGYVKDNSKCQEECKE